jgi:dihydrofolate synthase / folylpolyglutamate synthase
VSDAPRGGRFDAIVERLHRLHPRAIDLSLDRLRPLLTRLGNPERHLPPVIHVAGTNGKGSVCAFIRACAEATGARVHVYTSPHLVRFNERIRVAGELVDDATLADALEDVERANAGGAITVFEVITAVALLLFARTPAELCVLEVGLGGRLDATNVIPAPVASAITSISLDHRDWLGDTLEAIAREKAGIAKPGVPIVTGVQTPAVRDVLEAVVTQAGARLLARGQDWSVAPDGAGLAYADRTGSLVLPPPSLPGPHQTDNAGIAIAALRAAGVPFDPAGIGRATWPARLQRLDGALARMLPAGWELWLDGGHNAGAGEALAAHLAGWTDRPVHLVVGMKQSKDAGGFLGPLLPYARTLWAVVEPGQHLAQPIEAIIAASQERARPGPTVAGALRHIVAEGPPGRILICGSLYLAGEVLKADAGA